METTKMQFILTGFSEITGCRVFAFDGIAEDRTRGSFTVKADLALTRRYGIRLRNYRYCAEEFWSAVTKAGTTGHLRIWKQR